MKIYLRAGVILCSALLSGCFQAAHMRVEPPSRIEALERASISPLATALMLFVDQLDGRVLGASDFELTRTVVQRMRAKGDSTLPLLLAYAELRTELIELPNSRDRARDDLRQLLLYAGYGVESTKPVKSNKSTDPKIKQARTIAWPRRFLFMASFQPSLGLVSDSNASAQDARSIIDAMRAYAIADNSAGIKRTVEQLIQLARFQAENLGSSEDQITESEVAEALAYMIASSSPRRAAILLALPGLDPRDIISALLDFSAASGIELDRARLWRVLEYSELPSAERAAFVLQSVTPLSVAPTEREAALRHVAASVRSLSAPIELSDEQFLAELFIQIASGPQWRELVNETLEKLTNSRARAFGWLHSLASLQAAGASDKAPSASTDLLEVSRRIEQALLEALGDLSTRERIELLLEIDSKLNELVLAPTAAMQSSLKRMLSISWRELTP